MTKLTLATAVALGIALSGCMETKNHGVETAHQPVVQRADYVFDLPASGGGIASQDVARLSDWFGSLNVKYGDRISVDFPEGGTNSGFQADVRRVAARFGLLVEDVAPVTQGEIAPGLARVVVSRLQASVPNCPDWSTPSFLNGEANGHPNFGCAYNGNIAAMVADPRDLVEGREHVDSYSAKRDTRSNPNDFGGSN